MAECHPRARTPVVAALMLAAVCLVTAGCGRGASTEEEKIKSTVDTFLSACADEEPLIAGGVLSAPARERFVNGGDTLEGCLRVLALSLAPLPREQVKQALRRAEVKVERIGGGFATVLVEASPSRRGTVQLEDLNTIGTEWRIYDPRTTPPAPSGAPAPSEPQPPSPDP